MVTNKIRTDEEIRKFPSLRADLKVTRQIQSEKVTYVVKDPIKNEYFRFDESEWRIIALFDGSGTMADLMDRYHKENPGLELSLQDLRNFKESLSGIHLLEKPKKEQNILLVEKMKEMRSSQLLAKKGSLMYKRFPLVDPDKFFNRVIPHIQFFWTKLFFWFATLCIVGMFVLISVNFSEFHDGVRNIFSFSQQSFLGLFALWVTVYLTIAIHELGHGLTCKYYGGEVHELGLLLLFFQPCFYANVNDAWLFDKKWKQVMVTVAGAFIELWVGSIFALIWVMTNPLTFINTLSFQVVTICTASTVLANFNPLIKLDGYYLLSDFLELPNLRENASKYVQYLASKYIFRMSGEEFEASSREKRIYLIYGVLSAFWIGSMTLGLFFLARGFLIDSLHATGVLVSFWIAWKLFGGHVKTSAKFMASWYMSKRGFIKELLQRREVKIRFGIGAVVALGLTFIPLPYPVPGDCELQPSFVRPIRATTPGVIRRFKIPDGSLLKPGTVIAELENPSVETDRKVAGYAVSKLEYRIRKAMVEGDSQLPALQKELGAKKAEFELKTKKVQALDLSYEAGESIGASLSCEDQIKKTNMYFKKGDEVCRAVGTAKVKAVIEVSEAQVHYIHEGSPAKFRLKFGPLKTYKGLVQKVRVQGQPNPKNPKERSYLAEILIDNPGELRPGMKGEAKIQGNSASFVRQATRKLASFFRADLFF
ncbi:MAG: hypothetical protein AABZ06_11280 [Bdellovibrionota bacterium]